MESVQLHQFSRGIPSWPKSKAEFSAVAERAARLLNAPFVAFLAPHGAAAVGPGGSGVDLGVAEEFLRKQTSQMEVSGPLHQIQLGTEQGSGVPPILGGIRYLVFAPINGELKGPAVDSLERANPMQAWLVAGSEKALSPKEEVLLYAAAQRLSELARLERLETGIQLRNQFLSIASHELKTPLTSIYGVLQLQERMSRLKQDHVPTPASEQKRSYLKICLRQVERLNELIDGLLDVSRIQNGRFMVEPSENDAAELLRETVQGRLQLIAQEAGVKLHVEAPEKVSAWVDPVRFEEVVTNLVMNAIRFSPEGGVVWIKLREEAGSFRLTIRDQGPNVALEDRERLFQPFERAQRTSRLGGLGLGLYISRQIALLHGGNVSLVESVPGKGNVLEAYFPARSVSAISA